MVGGGGGGDGTNGAVAGAAEVDAEEGSGADPPARLPRLTVPPPPPEAVAFHNHYHHHHHRGNGTPIHSAEEALLSPLLKDAEHVEHATGSAFFAGFTTLSLFLMGSSILPVPYAFACSGLVLATLVTVCVALANYYTSRLLLFHATPRCASYEDLSLLAGGPHLRLLAQISLLLLLFGTSCGNMAVTADVARRAGQEILPKGDWRELVLGLPEHETGARLLCCITVMLLVPMSLYRRLDSLQYAGAVSVVVVFIIAGQVVVSAVKAGLPAFAWTPDVLWKVDGRAPQAIGIVGYAFYLQPALLPLSREMPSGRAGRSALKRALVATYALCTTVYVVIGAFGFLQFGQDTQGDIMAMYKGKWAAVLDAATVIYVAIAYPPVLFALRFTLEELLVGREAAFHPLRHAIITIIPILASLGVAVAIPQAEVLFNVTGATAVCLVCYILPVTIHLRLSAQERKAVSWVAWVRDVGTPWVVMVGGCIVSLAALLAVFY